MVEAVGSGNEQHRTPAIGVQVDELAQLYPAYRLAVISIIYAQPTAPIRDFSDAFKFRNPGH